ncbi:unnamed protein product, partial [Phaeothamnion confervicola]
FVICEWGCRQWVRRGQEQAFHESERCTRRVLACTLGCGRNRREDEWLAPAGADPDIPEQQYHEENDCPRRLVSCTYKCGEWIPFQELEEHCRRQCIRRPAPPLPCRNICGVVFHAGAGEALQAAEERMEHEQELCGRRRQPCAWPGCGANVAAIDRAEHRRQHVLRTGISEFAEPGVFAYQVAHGCRQLKVQVLGGGGGSGHMRGGRGPSGSGGAGAFVEVLLVVSANDEIEVTVGAGGAAGVYGPPEHGDPAVAAMDADDSAATDAIDLGMTPGGWPGGGAGHSGNAVWAAGGGGGYSSVALRRGPVKGVAGAWMEVLVVAGGGGGGGSRDGVGGGGLSGELLGAKVDKRNGRMGGATAGGEGGDSGDVSGCSVPAEAGRKWQGGAGAEFGGGGGGGWFGGGGGGTTPGIVGGGGGGSSFVLMTAMLDQVVLQVSDRTRG